MSKTAGFLLIVAGVGAAAYVVPHMDAASDRAERQLSEVVAIATSANKVSPAPVPMVAQPSVRPMPTSSADGNAAKPVQIVQAATVAKPEPAAASSPAETARLQLTRDIQRELKRVGCYTGDVDGVWNGAARQAMKSFIDRINATLPIDQPDYILKTLVQGHPGNACAKSCPSGQTAGADGRCSTPTSTVAQVPKRPVLKSDQAAAPARKQVASSWEPTVRPAITPSAPVLVMPPAPAAIPAPRVEPLPGRMAVGAQPSAPPPSITASDASIDARRPAIVIKPGTTGRSIDTARAEPRLPAEKEADSARPKLAAIAAAEAAPETTVAVPVKAVPTVERRTAPPPAAYRPPPRYVGAYQAPTPAPARARFGPSFFEKMAREGR